MQDMKMTISRVRPGFEIIAPSIAWGVLIGSVAALLLPSVIPVGSKFIQLISAYPTTKSGEWLDPWLRLVVPPDRLMWIGFATIVVVVFIGWETLGLFLRRCYTWSISEASLLWIACSFLIFRRSPWWALAVFIAGVFLTSVIAWKRTPAVNNTEPLLSSDRPIERSSEDKLGRTSLVLSLVNRLLEDDAQVIALIGAYGDGKTSILYLVAEELQKQDIVVVRFKSSLPGDDLTLASTLFNSVSKQLSRRFFVRRLDRILKRFARQLSGLVPDAPAGLKDVFAEPSQEDEIQELTSKLDKLPVRRVVVLLDDMDRMHRNELRMLLKIIRAADSYPKLSFVCAFNKKALVDASIRHQVMDRVSLDFSANGKSSLKGSLAGDVSADDTRSGYEYLEKFFPVQIPVPKLDNAQLADEFNARFNRFTEHQGLSMLPADTEAFDKEFNPFWKSHFREALNNLRKMNTYFNALNSSFSIVKKEVNVVDFMCIELLRQIDPEVYEQVFKCRSLFYYPNWDIQQWGEHFIVDDEKEDVRLKLGYEQVFRNLHGPERDFTVSLLSRLFPKMRKFYPVRGLYGGGNPNELEADIQKRIYHPDYFMTYFSLHVEQGYFSAKELEEFIEVANKKQDAGAAQDFFRDYLRNLTGLRTYRFLEKMSRVSERLEPVQAKALVISVALESDKLESDELDIGDLAAATKLVLIVANRFKDTQEITVILRDIIVQSKTDGFASRILQFGSDQERNKIFEQWDNVNVSELKSVLLQRLKAKYFKGGSESIYSRGTWRDWQPLLWWARNDEQGPEDVRAYLEDEFGRRPNSIGKHIFWLWNSLENPDGKKVVDDLFPLSKLAQLAKQHGSAAFSTESEKRIVLRLIKDYGESSLT